MKFKSLLKTAAIAIVSVGLFNRFAPVQVKQIVNG